MLLSSASSVGNLLNGTSEWDLRKRGSDGQKNKGNYVETKQASLQPSSTMRCEEMYAPPPPSPCLVQERPVLQDAGNSRKDRVAKSDSPAVFLQWGRLERLSSSGRRGGADSRKQLFH